MNWHTTKWGKIYVTEIQKWHLNVNSARNEVRRVSFDFFEKEIEMNGIVQYWRKSFSEDKTLIDSEMKKVYLSHNKNNKAVMQLDNDFIYVNDLFISNNQSVDKIGMISYINNDKNTLNYHMIST